MTGRTLDQATYLDLVDEVLVDAGRAELAPGGPARRIIEVRSDDRVLQIVASAGSGKTEMLVWRVLYELLVVGRSPNRLLVTTFTKKAANELELRLVERSEAILRFAHARGLTVADPHVHDLRIGTIHALCDQLMAEFDHDYMAAGTQMLDEIESSVHLAMSEAKTLPFIGGAPDRGLIPRIVACPELVCLFRPPWKTEQQWPSRKAHRVDALRAMLNQVTETWYPRCSRSGTPVGLDAVHSVSTTHDLLDLQRRWEAYLNSQSALDFTTLQKVFAERQASIAQHVDHVFVDEFQDTNPIQFSIHTAWLEGTTTKLTVVGDDDQSLYRFRGSDVDCFIGLERHCLTTGLGFRSELLEENWRSTRAIVEFSEAFRRATVLNSVSMPKSIRAPSSATPGDRPRLLVGGWDDLATLVADELDAAGAGRLPSDNSPIPPSAAILLFSTSESGKRKVATALREELESRGLRVSNPRNKTAGSTGPVRELFGLLSYLIDPVTKAPLGANGREVEVWATSTKAQHVAAARSAPPNFRIVAGHAEAQKKTLKENGGKVAAPNPALRDVFDYIDKIRRRLLTAVAEHEVDASKPLPNLTFTGLVARILTFPRYRMSGFTTDMFRQAMFTQLVEQHTAPSRRTMTPLDQPLRPRLRLDGKIEWPDFCWSMLNIMGLTLEGQSLDDIEVEAFTDGAIAVMTFHQAKGLEFDHVYVGLTGRSVAVEAVLQTKLFSGDPIDYTVVDGHPVTTDADVLELAEADREREIYVALTRAKSHLTIMHDPNDSSAFGSLNQGLERLFAGASRQQVAPGVEEMRYLP